VGCLPLPSLTHEQVVRANGATNVVPARAAKEAGVPRLVVVGRGLHSSTSQLNLSPFRHQNNPQTPPDTLIYPNHPLNNP
jgi:hypothetical protein